MDIQNDESIKSVSDPLPYNKHKIKVDPLYFLNMQFLKGVILQVDCTEMCVGSACTQPSYNDDKNPSSVLVLISLYVLPCLKSSRSIL